MYYFDEEPLGPKGIEEVLDDAGRVLERRRLFYNHPQEKFLVDWAESFTYTEDGEVATNTLDTDGDGVIEETYSYEYTGLKSGHHSVSKFQSDGVDGEPQLLTIAEYDGERLLWVDGYRARVGYDMCYDETPEDPCLTGVFVDFVVWRYVATFDEAGRKTSEEVYADWQFIQAGKPHETIIWEYDENGRVIHTSYVEDLSVGPWIDPYMGFLDRVWLNTHGFSLSINDIHDIYYAYDANGRLVRESRGTPPGTPGGYWLDFQYAGDCNAESGDKFIHF